MAYLLTIGDNAAPKVEDWTATNAADVAGIQQTEDAIEARQLHEKLAAIDRINTKMQSLDKTEVALTHNLIKEAIDAYHAIWGLAEKASGNNARTRVSNRFAAIMLARHAYIMAQRYNRLHPAEAPITALDWIKRVDIRAGQEGEAGGYHQGMYYINKSSYTSVKELRTIIKDRKARGEDPNQVKLYDKYSGVTYYEERISYGVNEHDLDDDDCDNIEAGLRKGLYNVHTSSWGKEYSGLTSVMGKIENENKFYVVFLEYLPKGDIIYKTAFPMDNEKAADGFINEKGARMLSTEDSVAVSTGHPLSCRSIQKKLGIVKKNKETERFNQEVSVTPEADVEYNIASLEDNNTIEFNLTTETEDVRAQRKAMMERMGFTPKEIQQAEEYFYGTDKKKGIIQEIQELAEKYNDFGEFQNKLSELVENKAKQFGTVGGVPVGIHAGIQQRTVNRIFDAIG